MPAAPSPSPSPPGSSAGGDGSGNASVGVGASNTDAAELPCKATQALSLLPARALTGPGP